MLVAAVIVLRQTQHLPPVILSEWPAHLDITAQTIELASRVADRRKNVFIARLAHELPNPLASIQNAAEILSCRGPNDPMFGRPLATIRGQIEHLSRLVDVCLMLLG
jgi:signal transduction histidine kinase